MSSSVPPAKEPPQTFITFLEAVDDGRLSADCTEQLEKLVAELRSLAQIQGMKPRGRIEVRIGIEALPGGALMSVVYDVKTKMPPRPKAPSTFWPTKYNCLSPVNPAQLTMPGLDVTSPKQGETMRVLP